MGKCLRTSCAVSPGQVEKWLFLMAFSQVLRTGEKQAACKYCARSDFVVSLRMMTASDGCDATRLIALKFLLVV